LTPLTFASGFERKGVETSLLPKLDGKIIVMKDFGTVLTMYREKRAEILAQLREIYGGSFTKDFGNGKSVRWSGKVGLLAGCTTIIDRAWSLNQILGERFLLYRIPPPPAREMAKRALQQRSREADQRRKLRGMVGEFLSEVAIASPTIPPAMLEGLAAMAEFTAKARSPIVFDQRGEMELIPPPEGPGRLAKQLCLMMEALACVRSEPVVTLETYRTTFNVAQDCMPAPRRVMLGALFQRRESANTTEIAEMTGYPTNTARRYLQELTALGLVDRIPEGPGKADRWEPSKDLVDLLRACREPLIGAEDLTSNVRGCGK
jgi:IclR helix-turn-helix domain